MAYTVTSFCTQCNDCLPMCPTNAIKQQGEHLWIDSMLCNSIPQSHLWHLLDTQHHFQTDHLGSQHLTGMTFTIKPGEWAQFFLNRQNSRAGTAFFQYGTLPKSLLTNVGS